MVQRFSAVAAVLLLCLGSAFGGAAPDAALRLRGGGAGWEGDAPVAGASGEEEEASLMEAALKPAAKGSWTPWSTELGKPSSGRLLEFYMYRAVSDEKYDPINVNTANIPGVLWYLHHEVVIQYPRKNRIANIERIKVKVRATEPLLQRGMNFGPRLAMDRGQATGPFVCGRQAGLPGQPEPMFCDGGPFDLERQMEILPRNGKPYHLPFEYGRYGFHVGCNNLGEHPFPRFPVNYTDAVWYTLPGACTSNTFDKGTVECLAREPGGLCEGEPTGEGNCTWSYEYMGRLSIDELVHVPADMLHMSGGREYNPDTDQGIKTTFWDGIDDAEANDERIKALRALFAKKFPEQTLDEDMPSPPCDFDFGAFYQEFWLKAPFSGKCQDAIPGDDCDNMMQWAKSDGIYGYPEWYPGLSPSSSLKDFQQLFFMAGREQCPFRPCGIAEGDAEAWTSSLSDRLSKSSDNTDGSASVEVGTGDA